jgi:hypothetical protein
MTLMGKNALMPVQKFFPANNFIPCHFLKIHDVSPKAWLRKSHRKGEAHEVRTIISETDHIIIASAQLAPSNAASSMPHLPLDFYFTLPCPLLTTLIQPSRTALLGLERHFQV